MVVGVGGIGTGMECLWAHDREKDYDLGSREKIWEYFLEEKVFELSLEE